MSTRPMSSQRRIPRLRYDSKTDDHPCTGGIVYYRRGRCIDLSLRFSRSLVDTLDERTPTLVLPLDWVTHQ
eukprot:1172631-Prorocentrum_minimum.AAC.1